ncbi:MAG: membrane protein insertase YidC [Bacilli bacterium]|nr:membrane protein insertase YidC [Bacilli bacterium]
MKKGTKIGLGVALLALGTIAITGCTQSFCSNIDSARIMYAYDPGITRYSVGGSETFEVSDAEKGTTYKISGLQRTVATWNSTINGFSFGEKDHLSNLNTIISTSNGSGYYTIGEASLSYYQRFDQIVFEEIFKEVLKNNDGSFDLNLSNPEDETTFKNHLSKYSYVKFVTNNSGSMWNSYNSIDKRVRETVPTDSCPSTDFNKLYQSRLSSYASSYRTCLTTREDKYGSYGYDSTGVYIEAKNWGDAWGKGFFEGLLVFPIGWLIDQIVGGFRLIGVADGASALLGIVFVTLIIRSVMLLATIKQTASTAKMNELQPEIQKIQNKYPNSNTSQVEKQRMAEEMNRLYKKNKINPFTSLIVMIIQFPVFICVWGALSGSSAITNGSLLGLSLSLGIKDVLFVASNWTAAGGYSAVTALFLFLLMAGAQTVSMLLPQWIQKSKAKKVSKLGKNPAQQSQNKQMKIFTYVMLAMIIFMGFSLVSAMGIYWFVGAIFSIIQTFITQLITSKNAKKK